MRMPTSTKPLFQGAMLGAIACAIIGFTWRGWVTSGTARSGSDVGAIANAIRNDTQFRALGMRALVAD